MIDAIKHLPIGRKLMASFALCLLLFALIASLVSVWLVEKEVDGFLVQLPAYDFAAAARLVLNRWQQQAWRPTRWCWRSPKAR